MSAPGRLYHFTCSHAAPRIGAEGLIIPQVTHPYLRQRISWFTTEAEPDRTQTGLTMDYTACDRMEFRYVITDLSGCQRWLRSTFRAAASKHGRPGALLVLESHGDPWHWWASDQPVPAVRDLTWQHGPVKAQRGAS